ncbi:hypothetical protein GO296_04652 [Ralstonia solanacearum]|nr:hypothetical protein [Ralstonia solanacearum]NKF56589.1 hypothetical protein [Ralstonia solanacearum]NKF62418.1 hypothetical protein [Ralstonia solanacearum]NKF67374.1 hypothetical protein [Ralstonia solanacearum]NKF72360.1 hypothetical protein [Ralstonia solanacearum]
MRNGQRRDRLAQALSDLLGRRQIGILQQHREGPAPMAGNQIAIAPDVLGQTLRDRDQALVTLELAVSVVEILEAIDLDHQR